MVYQRQRIPIRDIQGRHGLWEGWQWSTTWMGKFCIKEHIMVPYYSVWMLKKSRNPYNKSMKGYAFHMLIYIWWPNKYKISSLDGGIGCQMLFLTSIELFSKIKM